MNASIKFLALSSISFSIPPHKRRHSMQLDFCIINDGSQKNNNILPDPQKKRGKDVKMASREIALQRSASSQKPENVLN
jgi:hypothetical protein